MVTHYFVVQFDLFPKMGMFKMSQIAMGSNINTYLQRKYLKILGQMLEIISRGKFPADRNGENKILDWGNFADSIKHS
jgi:hypothetical protein